MCMKLIISSVSGEPIYEQIKRQIREAVGAGQLAAGDALPSLRTLAKELRVSVLTVTRAYTELAQEGVVRNVQGRGSFVAERGADIMREQCMMKVRAALREACVAAREGGIQPNQLHALLDEMQTKELS